ncbi:MAG: amidohydrolase family protein [Deltaproteobacteria bacterium]|nr:amidohydrolase family protein [Deltaproteobacteria bacterium]
MKNIDSHLHLWDTKRFRYPWFELGAFPDLPNTYLLQDAIADAGTTEAAFVVLQAEVDHSVDPVEETEWMQHTVDNHPQGDRLAGFVAYADLSQPDVERVIERHAQYAVFRGIRQEIWWQQPSPRPDILEKDMLASSDWRRGFEVLGRVGAVFDLTCWYWQLGPFAAFLSDHPHVPVIIDHLGSPIAGDTEALKVWLKGMRELAALPNTFMKISGLSQADAHWSVDSLRPLVLEVLGAFGPERCMLGSNFPPEKLSSTYSKVWSAFEALFSELSHDEREKLFHTTAEKVYRLAN